MFNAKGCKIINSVTGARPDDPCSWNGWEWNRTLFPDPEGFLQWAHQHGLQVGLNIHPSISSNDPKYPETVKRAGQLAIGSAKLPCYVLQADPSSECHVFDWTKPEQLKAYFALHKPFSHIDFWWLDWCCDGSSAVAPGLTADTWINAHYKHLTQSHGSRWPVLSRIGSSFQTREAGIGNNGINGALAAHRDRKSVV